MTQAQIDALKSEIDAAIDTGSTIATAIAPEYLPFIVLGKAVAKQVPGLLEDVVKLVEKTEPTDADTLALAQSIARLSHPESL